MMESGWLLKRAGKKLIQGKRPKTNDRLLKDRVWCLFYQMGFSRLNGDNFTIQPSETFPASTVNRVDVYCEDQEVAIVVECISRKDRGRRSLQKEIQDSIDMRPHVREAIALRYGRKNVPKLVWIYATTNIIWSQPDIERAEAGSIRIITENEIQYFETFIRHMGPSGKYQILGEFLRDQKVAGLSNVKIPAVRGKVGGEVFYSFVTTPGNLLKIAFINHQALNHPDGRPAYQRMISSKRIKEISAFIRNGGFSLRTC
jgi:hypothetical protein